MAGMGMRSLVPAGLVLWLVSATAEAVFTVNMPWVRPTAERRETEAYMVLTSSEGAVLRQARSPIAAMVVIRAAGAAGRKLDQLPLPAGAAVKLAPGEWRLGLIGLSRPLKVAERVPVVLVIEAPDGTRQEIPVNAEVRRHSPIDDERRAHQHPQSPAR
jgi:copper(I)-binding protein